MYLLTQLYFCIHGLTLVIFSKNVAAVLALKNCFIIFYSSLCRRRCELWLYLYEKCWMDACIILENTFFVL